MKNFITNREGNRNKWLSVAYLLLRLSVVIMMVNQILNKNYENVFLCVLTLILFMVPSFIERKIHIDIPDTFEVIILLFIFSAEILGEIRSYYLLFPYWDTLLHTLNGFLCGAIGFSLIDILNRNDKFSISLSPVFVALVAFCFSMTMGVMWEFLEFGADRFLGFDMQKDTYLSSFHTVLLQPDGKNIPTTVEVKEILVNGEVWESYIDIGLIDTMMDLFVNFVGAIIFSVFGYFYIKGRGKGNLVKRFRLRLYTEQEREEKQNEK